MGPRRAHRRRASLASRLVSASAGRVAALKIVSRVRERRGFAHETADAVFSRSQQLDPRDRALATRLAYGTIATAGALDDAIDRFVSAKVRLEPRVRDALEIAAWELLFGGTEPHVAVNEGVELVRSARPQAAGLANAVLRRLADAAPEFPWGDPTLDTAALARLYGHPLWMTELLISDLGRSRAEDVLRADNSPAPVYLAFLAEPSEWDRISARLEDAGAVARPGPVAGSLEVENVSAVARSGLFAEQAVEVCDAGAQFAVHAVAPAPGMKIVEIGAGRGTKTLLLQALARREGDDARIWAVDSHQFKLDVLAERASQAGFGGIETITANGTELPFGNGLPARGEADAVLIDAPCSGLGTLRRHPDKRWRLRSEEIDGLALLGGRLLQEASLLVRPGGFVVYSTCTLTSRENRDVVERFLGSPAGEGFGIEDLSKLVPEQWRRFVSEEGLFQSVPEAGGPDGHFVARLRRA